MNIFIVIIGFVVIALFGFCAIFYPEKMWELEHFFDVKNGQPTEWYINKMRLLGLMLWIAEIIFFFRIVIGYFNGTIAF